MAQKIRILKKYPYDIYISCRHVNKKPRLVIKLTKLKNIKLFNIFNSFSIDHQGFMQVIVTSGRRHKKLSFLIEI